jgi:hypothetical protein
MGVVHIINHPQILLLYSILPIFVLPKEDAWHWQGRRLIWGSRPGGDLSETEKQPKNRNAQAGT